MELGAGRENSHTVTQSTLLTPRGNHYTLNFHFPPTDFSFITAPLKSIKECSSPPFLWTCMWFAFRPHVLNCSSLSLCWETEGQKQAGLDLFLSICEPPTGDAEKYLCDGRDLIRDWKSYFSSWSQASVNYELKLHPYPSHTYKLRERFQLGITGK